MAAESVVPICYVNGKRYELPEGRAEATLLQCLREIHLTGTKLGCAEGGCGACTVMVSHQAESKLVHRSVNACLCPLYAIEGMHVVTVEGLGNPRKGLHPVQARLAKAHGSQCGFCTPGFVMSMYSLLRSKTEAPTETEIEDNLAGNLCRCTGYRPILDAFKVFAKADPAAYTEESIAASKSQQNGYTTNGAAANGHDTTGLNGHPANGLNGHATLTNGHTTNGDDTDGHATNGHKNNRYAVHRPSDNGHLDGHTNGSSNGTVKELTQTIKSKGGKVCPSTGRPCDCSDGQVINSSEDKQVVAELKHEKPPQEPIFPPELRKRQASELCLAGPLATWHRPLTMAGLFKLKAEFPDARLVVGNTEVGIEMKFKDARYPVLIGVTHIPELNHMEVVEDGLWIGSSVTLSDLMDKMRSLIKSQPAHEVSACTALLNQLKYFAGNQIRNTASVGGNIVTGSPISDSCPLYMACGATFVLQEEGKPQRSVLAEDFFLGYRRVDLQPKEILVKVFLPYTQKLEYVKEFKQAHRRDDDIAIANAGMRVRFKQTAEGELKVEQARICYGGVAPKCLMATNTQAALEGQPWTQATLDAALLAVAKDVSITPDAPGGMVEFRRSLASSFLFRFFVHVASQLEADQPGFQAIFPPTFKSAAVPFHRPPVQGLQYYSKVPGEAVVGQPTRHMAADLQVCGEAVYVDDMKMHNMLHAALVYSSRPHAKILSVDASAAIRKPGVAGYFGHKDVPGGNDIGAVMHDEECFASEVVTCIGHVIGVVVADTEQHARMAARLVKVKYEDLPPLISIEDAIEAESFYEGWGKRIDCGDVDKVFESKECDHVIEGTCKMGGQEHFYLEPHGSIVVPLENDEIKIIASTQAPAKHQQTIAHVLGIPHHKVVCHVKRIGGGFGGKESRSVFPNAAAAVPAYILRRPVRLVLDRDEDMHMTGHRHAFLGKYKVAFNKDGKVQALDCKLYNNAGNSLDLSAAIMERAVMHIDNAYKIPNVRVVGLCCKTNIASNTAYRGFGGPQGMLVTEMWMDRIAHMTEQPLQSIRHLNLYQEQDKTHYGQILHKCQVQACWDGVISQAHFAERQAAVDDFNKANRWRKRGLAVIPTKFGISFTTKFLNQGAALVHIYTDGTVLVTHGGVEMGQGLHTKVAQVAAADLGIPLSSVYIAETATDKVPNSSPTAASASSDMYGSATADACAQLNARLKPYREQRPDSTFTQLVNAAYLDRVDLSAHGFYATPDVTGFGDDMPFNYFTYGAACSEVELDTLTGDFQSLRTHIVMDVGSSVNPAIDIGQVEGGFVQGMGWTCLEELVWGDKEHKWVKPGVLHTRGPGTYKIPSANDIPLDFCVTLLKDSPNHRLPMVYSSKAVGEPPFFLGASVFFALKEAVYAARKDAGLEGWFQLDSPATPERLRMACADHLTEPFGGADIQVKLSC
ncbi:TPA: hypothetical protein ACH3X2_010250 [Trebouxia sp. C0005]